MTGLTSGTRAADALAASGSRFARARRGALEIAVLLPFLILLMAADAAAQEGAQPAAWRTDPPPVAHAELRDAQGRRVGFATLHAAADSSAILRLDLDGAPPGLRALHVHERGVCEAPSFESAGDHFAPAGRQHGVLNPSGPHAGDLPNLQIPEDGDHVIELFTPWLRLDAAGRAALLDGDGAAIVIHEGDDDHRTDPTGEAGGRAVCGVLVPGTAPPGE